MIAKADLRQIRSVIKTELKPVAKDVKTLKSDVSKIRKDIDVIITLFDREYINLRKRVEAIEEHLGIQSASV